MSHIHYINGPREDAPIPRPGMDLIKGQVATVKKLSALK